MAIQMFNDVPDFGTNLGTRLGGALTMLAESKIKEKLEQSKQEAEAKAQQQREQAKRDWEESQAQRMEQMYISQGANPQEAYILARTESAQGPYWKAKIQAPGNEMFSQALGLYGGMGGGQQQMSPTGPMGALSDLGGQGGLMEGFGQPGQTPGMVNPQGVQDYQVLKSSNQGIPPVGQLPSPQSRGTFGIPPTLSPDQASKIATLGQAERHFTATESGKEKRFAQKATAEEKKLAIDTNKDFVKAQQAVRDSTPQLITDYEKIASIAEKNPGKLRTAGTKAIMESLGLGAYGKSPEENIVAQSMARIRVNRAQAMRGLGNFSDRDASTIEQAEASLWQTPKGISTISRGLALQEKSKNAVAKAEEKIRDKFGYLPLGGDIQAYKDSEKERAKYAEQYKELYRKEAGVEFYEDFPKSYAAEVKDLKPGQKVQIPETGAKFIKERNGKMRFIPDEEVQNAANIA